MRDSSGSDSTRPAAIGPTIAATADKVTLRSPRPAILNLIMAGAVMVCCTFAVMAAANTITAAGIGYLSLTAAMFACAASIWTRARSASRDLQVRWLLLSAAMLLQSIAYFPSFSEFIFKTPPERLFQTTCFNASEALVVLAAVLFFAGGDTLSILVVDIDHFKQANDLHGHLHGDRVLIELARDLESLAADVAGSHPARLGGDEFAFLLPDVTPQKASALAEDLRGLFRAHRFQIENGESTLSSGPPACRRPTICRLNRWSAEPTKPSTAQNPLAATA